MRLSLLLSLFTLPLLAISSTSTLDATLTVRTSKCGSDEFSYLIPGAVSSCCLKTGGVPGATCPSDKYCPSSTYYHPTFECCVPTEPSKPVPSNECRKDYAWTNNCCQKTSPTAPNGCDLKTSFEYSLFGFDICLPLSPPGGSCPPEKTCPSYYTWHTTYKCCVPTVPSCPPPPPKCENGWPWSELDLCCKKPPPTPSGKKRAPERRREEQRVETMSCPGELVACPMKGLMGNDWECVNPTHDLHSCGGCTFTGVGTDCTEMVGARNVGCETGTCVAYTCAIGWTLQNGTCVLDL